MALTLPALLATEVAKRTGGGFRVLMSITPRSTGTGRFLATDELTIDAQAYTAELIEVEPLYLSEGQIAEVGIRVFDSALNRAAVELAAAVNILLWPATGATGSDAMSLFQGEVSDPIERSSGAIRFEAVSLAERQNRLMGEAMGVAEFPSIGADARGLIKPIIYGTVTGHRCLPANVGALSTLAGALSAHATTIPLSDASRFPNSGTVYIGTEQITYTGKSGNSLTGCVRNPNNGHSANAEVLEKKDPNNDYLIAAHPVSTVRAVYVDGVLAASSLWSLVNGSPSYIRFATPAQVSNAIDLQDSIAVQDSIGVSDTISGTITADRNLAQSTTATTPFTLTKTTSAAGSGTTDTGNYSWPATGGTELSQVVSLNFASSTVSVGPAGWGTSDYVRLEVYPASTGPGTGVIIYERIRNPVAINPGSSIAASASSASLNAGGAVRFRWSWSMTSHFSISLRFIGLQRSAYVQGLFTKSGTAAKTGAASKLGTVIAHAPTDVVFGREVTCDLDGYADDASGTITGAASSVITRPDHVVRHLLRTYGGASDAETAAAYFFAFVGDKIAMALTDRWRVRDVVSEVALHCRGLAFYHAGRWRMIRHIGLTDGFSVAATLSDDEILRGEAGESSAQLGAAGSLRDAANKHHYRANQQPDGTWAIEATIDDATSQSNYGVREKALDLPWTPLAAQARAVALFHSGRDAHPETGLLNLLCGLDQIALELGDAVAVTGTKLGGASMRGEVVGVGPVVLTGDQAGLVGVTLREIAGVFVAATLREFSLRADPPLVTTSAAVYKYTLTGYTPNVGAGAIVNVPVYAMTLTGWVTQEDPIEPPAGALTLTGYAPQIGPAVPLHTFTLTGLVPALGFWGNDTYIDTSAWLDGSADYLHKTYAGAGNQQEGTLSIWFARNDPDAADEALFSAFTDADNYVLIWFNVTTNTLTVRFRISATNYDWVSTREWYDTEWQHLVVAWDTVAQTLSAWHNGVAISWSSSDTLPASANTAAFDNVKHDIGADAAASDGKKWNGMLAQVVLVDGTAHAATDFGEFFETGAAKQVSIWAPLADATVAALASTAGGNSVALTADIEAGTDASTASNDYTAESISANAYAVESPSNPGVRWSALAQSLFTVTEGGVTITDPAGTTKGQAIGTMGPVAAKLHVEFDLTGDFRSADNVAVGLIGRPVAATGQDHSTDELYQLLYESSGDLLDGTDGSVAATSSYGAAFGAADTVVMEVDFDSDTVEFFTGGATRLREGGGDRLREGGGVRLLEAQVGGDFTSQGVHTCAGSLRDRVYTICASRRGTGGATATIKVVAHSADFVMTPSSNYVGWTNINARLILSHPANNNRVITYTGDGTSVSAGGQAVTGLGMEPGAVLIADVDNAVSRRFFHKARAANVSLFTNLINPGAAEAEALASFDPDGFTVGNQAGVNTNTAEHVALALHAADPATNVQGDIGIDIGVSQSGHYSVGRYVGDVTAVANQTVGHGGSTAPDMVIIKNADSANALYGWVVIAPAILGSGGAGDYLYLHTDGAEAPDGNLAAMPVPGADVVDLGSYIAAPLLNGNANAFIMQNFWTTDGVLLVADYTGNGSADGPVVICGFRPAMVWVKRYDLTGNWHVYDSAREADNVRDDAIYLDATTPEASVPGVALLANGFQVRSTDAELNANAGTYLCVAFADATMGDGLPPIPGQ